MNHDPAPSLPAQQHTAQQQKAGPWWLRLKRLLLLLLLFSGFKTLDKTLDKSPQLYFQSESTCQHN